MSALVPVNAAPAAGTVAAAANGALAAFRQFADCINDGVIGVDAVNRLVIVDVLCTLVPGITQTGRPRGAVLWNKVRDDVCLHHRADIATATVRDRSVDVAYANIIPSMLRHIPHPAVQNFVAAFSGCADSNFFNLLAGNSADAIGLAESVRESVPEAVRQILASSAKNPTGALEDAGSLIEATLTKTHQQYLETFARIVGAPTVESMRAADPFRAAAAIASNIDELEAIEQSMKNLKGSLVTVRTARDMRLIKHTGNNPDSTAAVSARLIYTVPPEVLGVSTAKNYVVPPVTISTLHPLYPAVVHKDPQILAVYWFLCQVCAPDGEVTQARLNQAYVLGWLATSTHTLFKNDIRNPYHQFIGDRWLLDRPALQYTNGVLSPMMVFKRFVTPQYILDQNPLAMAAPLAVAIKGNELVRGVLATMQAVPTPLVEFTEKVTSMPDAEWWYRTSCRRHANNDAYPCNDVRVRRHPYMIRYIIIYNWLRLQFPTNADSTQSELAAKLLKCGLARVPIHQLVALFDPATVGSPTRHADPAEAAQLTEEEEHWRWYMYHHLQTQKSNVLLHRDTHQWAVDFTLADYMYGLCCTFFGNKDNRLMVTGIKAAGYYCTKYTELECASGYGIIAGKDCGFAYGLGANGGAVADFNRNYCALPIGPLRPNPQTVQRHTHVTAPAASTAGPSGTTAPATNTPPAPPAPPVPQPVVDLPRQVLAINKQGKVIKKRGPRGPYKKRK